jgi:uncharacterized protein
MSAAPPVAVPLLGFGTVRHARLRPARNAFSYPTYFLLLPMRSMQDPQSEAAGSALARNRAAALSFHDRDHGDGRGPETGGALAWLDELLQREGITDARGEVWLHCYPRVLGFTFKPVSFWYCHRSDGSLAAVVVEVNNTFGERHCYLLTGKQLAFGRELRATKVFHVSPFCAVSGSYRFRFMCTGLLGDTNAAPAHTVARIDHHDDEGLLIQTSVSGELRPLTPARCCSPVSPAHSRR